MRDCFGNTVNKPQTNNKITSFKKEGAVPIPAVPDALLRKTTIVIPIHNSLRTLDPMFRSLKERTSPLVNYVLVNDASDSFTRQYIDNNKLPNCTVLRNKQNLKYTKTINKGFAEAIKQGAQYVIALNSDIMVTDGWVERLLTCATSSPKVGIVCPYMSNAALITLDIPSGANYMETAERLAATSKREYPNAVTPVGACMMVDADLWKECGPFDEEESPEGYGEECFFWVAALKAKWKALIADDCFVYHESHASFGKEASKREKVAVTNFLSKHNVFFSAKRAMAQQKDILPRLKHDICTFSMQNDKPNICFYIASIQLCGGILALVNICNELNEMGVNATIAFERDLNNEWALMPTRFKPIRLSDGGKNWLKDGGFKNGRIVATAWFTAQFVLELCGKFNGLSPMAFVQDREDQFRLPNGAMQYSRFDEVQPYISIVKHKSVINSNWVYDSLKKDYRIPEQNMTYIPIGVDPYLFYPRINRELKADPKVRILSFCRVSTPRRGWTLLSKLYEKIYSIHKADVEMLVYGENPNPKTPCRGLGRLKQAELAAEMAKADILIEPSLVQGWGMPGQEMMATEGCLISTDNGGIHNYGVHLRNCLIGGHTVDSMYKQVAKAIRDPGLRFKLGKQARIDVMSLQWSKIAEAWKEALVK